MLRRARLAVLALFCACSSPAEGTLALVTGPETDVLSRDPAVRILVVETVTEDGTADEIARVGLPVETIDLGSLPQESVAAFRVRGEDTGGVVRVRGESLPLRYGTLAGTALPVYLQRTGETARFPSSFSGSFPSSTLSLVASRFVMGTEGTRGALYDLALLAPAAERTFPVAPGSVVAQGTRVLLVSDAAKATLVDLESGEESTLDPPAGGAFADVAGGATIVATATEAYVVGATRTDRATSRVLRVTSDMALSFVELAHPRKGAGAAWIDGRGLLVAGGDAAAPGLEVLATGATRGADLAFPPLAAEGLAVVGNGTRAVVVGGSPALHAVDLACGAGCTFTAVAGAAPSLASARALRIGDTFLAGGTSSAGEARLYALDGSAPVAARELPLKERRTSLSLLALPTGNVAIVGGGSSVIESFRP